MKIAAVNDNVVVARHETAAMAGSLLLPEQVQRKSTIGTVISVGPGVLLQSGEYAPWVVKSGDLIVFPAHAGTEIPVGTGTICYIKQSDIIGILTE